MDRYLLLKFLTLPLLLLIPFLIISFPWRYPFHPADLLPLLPREASWPILTSLHSAVDLLPTFVGAASSPNSSLEWKGACFYETTAWMEFHNKSKSRFGGGTLHVKTSKAHSWTCMDLYIFATPYRLTWDYYFVGREHTLDIKEWEGEAELEYVKHHGLSIFLMQSGMIGTLRALWDVFPLFTNTGWGESSNLAFLEKRMGATFEQRPQPWVSNFSVDDIHSGDFLAISKIRGRWGGFETLEKWVTGAFAGHTAVCLKDSEGKLWVAESGHEDEKGEDIIAVLPWDEWWDFEINEDDSNPQIALLPLHPDIRAKFNTTAAWEYARSMSGKPYGYHNMIFSWIDTLNGNYPPPLDAQVVASGMTMWNKMQPAYAANMWNEALNKRLGTQTSKAHSWTCMDLYIFATPYRLTWDYYFVGREHTLEIKEWEGEAELEYVKHHGLSIFLMQSGMIGTLRALWDVFPLFTNTGWGESSNLVFLEKHMGATFEQRPQPWVSNFSVDDIHSGDFLAISKIRGRWGGFETLEKWVTGAFAGHTAVCLKDSEGKLWVAESGHEDEKGEDIIAVLPWDEWWDFEINEDDSNPQIALLPLHPDIRAKFNTTAAWEYARSMSGKPYGYHNMIFSWIDTLSGNYPPPLDAQVVASGMTMWNKMQPAYAANMWNEALNKRLGTQDLDLPEIIVEAEKRGVSFDRLLTVPEQDDWTYSDGSSTSCVAFILEMYKKSGIFDPIANSIQVTEFTIKDAYTLKFFEDDSSRLPVWCNKDDDVKLPFCQIKGKYRMELPSYNTMQPYPHMNEHCPSLSPNYAKTPNC